MTYKTRAPVEVALTDEWPGKAFLVPSRATLVSASHPVTVNGKLARENQTVEAGDVICPAGSGNVQARFVLQDLPSGGELTRKDWFRVFGTYLHDRCGDTIDIGLLETLTPEERTYFDELIARIVARGGRR